MRDRSCFVVSQCGLKNRVRSPSLLPSVKFRPIHRSVTHIILRLAFELMVLTSVELRPSTSTTTRMVKHETQSHPWFPSCRHEDLLSIGKGLLIPDCSGSIGLGSFIPASTRQFVRSCCMHDTHDTRS